MGWYGINRINDCAFRRKTILFPTAWSLPGESLLGFGGTGVLPESSKASLPHAPYGCAHQPRFWCYFPRYPHYFLLDIPQAACGIPAPRGGQSDAHTRIRGGLQNTPFPGKGQEELLGRGTAVIEHRVSSARLWLPQT